MLEHTINTDNAIKDNSRIYIAIDLKSFYASVECVERNLDPLTTNLVVADASRTQKTICLAVSPSLKKYGISGRARLYQVVSRVNEINASRKTLINNRNFTGKSFDSIALDNDDTLEMDYIIAQPRMAKYIEYSTKIYGIYLRYIAPEDIHVYSIDECFLDVTSYLKLYKMNAYELAATMLKDVLNETGITATAGIGTNMYLCKIALDIVAKHISADKDGVRIAYLDEMRYRKLLWEHKPISDFWRVGRGIERKLSSMGMYTMGDVALCSIHNEDCLYNAFGVNAELLIDHAWGYENVTIKDIKEYKPEVNSLSTGQVLKEPYEYDKGELIVKEMADLLVLDLVKKDLVTDQIVLTVGYDISNLSDPKRRAKYKGEIMYDHYGRQIPKCAHGTINLKKKNSSSKLIIDSVTQLYRDIVDPMLTIRRINICANNVTSQDMVNEGCDYEQITIFENYDMQIKEREEKKEFYKQEKKLQEALITIHKRFGKNSMLKGMNLLEGATTMERNGQVGGHKA